MNFTGLLFHALKVFSVFRSRILISSTIYSFIFYYIFDVTNNLNTFLLILPILIVFNFTNFYLADLSKRFSKKFSKNLKIKYY